MTRPYSVDLRERMVRAVEAGASRRATAAKFEVSPSCVVKLMQRWRQRGTLAARSGSAAAGAPSSPTHAERVHALLAATPDLTIAELQSRLAAEGIAVSPSAISRFLKACGLTRKKRPQHAAEQDRPDVAAARRAWRAAAAGAEPGAAGVHRRDLGHHRHGAALRPGAARPPRGRRRAPRPLEDHDLPRRAAPRRPHRPCVFDGAINGARFLRLRRAGPGADAARRRRRGDGQPQRPQGRRRARGDRGDRRAAALPAALQSRI